MVLSKLTPQLRAEVITKYINVAQVSHLTRHEQVGIAISCRFRFRFQVQLQQKSVILHVIPYQGVGQNLINNQVFSVYFMSQNDVTTMSGPPQIHS